MRLLPVLLVALPWVLPAVAQPAAPPTASPAASEAAAQPHHRVTWQQRFAQANLSHDGHLTLDQAKGGYAAVARHFAEIDTAKKSYVTEDDIIAWHKMQRATHHSAPNRAEESLRPRPAVHHSAMDPQSMTPTVNATPTDHSGTAPSAPGNDGTAATPSGPGA